jgi:SET domain-containing protein
MQVKKISEDNYGVFATCDMPEKTCLGKYTGEIIESKADYERRNRQLQWDGILDRNFVRLHGLRYLDATFVGNRTKFLNHDAKVLLFFLTP